MGGNDQTRLTALRSTEMATEDVPARILIAPWGEVQSTNGDFLVDEQGVQAAIAQFREHGTDLPIDFEHQTLGGAYSSPDGLAPAAGWIKSLMAEPAVGLMAEVQWTPRGIEQLRTKQYRYLSPVAIIRGSDRRMVGLHSAALTNKPAIVGMEAIINRTADTAVARASGARATVVSTVRSDSEPQHGEEHVMLDLLNNLRTQLNLNPEVGTRQVLLAASQRLQEVQEQQSQRSAEDRVVQAMACGKLTEAQRDWAMQLALKDGASFEDWLASAPVVVCLGRTVAPDDGDLAVQVNRAAAARARGEYRASAMLQALTTEEAYVKYAT